MTIQEALVLLLSTDPTIAGLVQTLPAPARIYPQQAPQSDQLPYVLYASSDPEQAMDFAGYINFFTARFRFDVYGGPTKDVGYSSATAIGRAIRSRLFSFLRGDVGGNPGGVTIQGIFDDGGEDGLESPIHSEELATNYVAVQIRCTFNLN